MKKIYNTVGTVPKSNRNTIERGKIDNPGIYINDSSHSWFGIVTLIRTSGGVELVLLTKPK